MDLCITCVLLYEVITVCHSSYRQHVTGFLVKGQVKHTFTFLVICSPQSVMLPGRACDKKKQTKPVLNDIF